PEARALHPRRRGARGRRRRDRQPDPPSARYAGASAFPGAEAPLGARRALCGGGAGRRKAGDGTMDVLVVRDAEAVSASAAELFVEAAAGATAARGKAIIALTGGSSAPALFQELRGAAR